MKALFACVALAACSTPKRPKTYTFDELDLEQWTAGLAVHGEGGVTVMLSSTAPEDWRTVTGTVVVRCEDCVLGAPNAEAHPPGGFWGMPSVKFGELALGTVTGRAEFGDGRVHVTAAWRSADIELDARVDGTLGRTADETVLTGCIVWRPSEALHERDPGLYALLSTTGAPENGELQIAVDGTFGAMRMRATLCSIK